jgi:hypothetical protein
MASKVSDGDGEQPTYIYVKSFYHRALRKRLFARDYGKRAFKLRIRRK